MIPNLYIDWFISFVLFHIYGGAKSIIEIVYDFISSIPELCMFWMVGYVNHPYLVVTWYISAMFIVILCLYPIGVKNQQLFFDVVTPLVAMLCFGWLYKNNENLDTVFIWSGLFFSGTIRAFCGIAAGCICFSVSEHLRKYEYTIVGKVIITVLEYIFVMGAVLYMAFEQPSKVDFIIQFLLFGFAVLQTANVGVKIAIFNNRFSQFLGEYSFSFYLGHSFLRILHVHLYDLSLSPEVRFTRFMIDSFMISFVIYMLSIYSRKLFRNLNIKKYIVKST